MRSCWETLHAGLARSLEAAEAARSFEELRRRSPVLAPFHAPAQVAEFLSKRSSGVFERDPVLRCLVQEATKGSARRISLALLLLGLWPGLDGILRRRRSFFQPGTSDLELEIIDQFTTQVHRISLTRVSCLAATLVLNTEREIVDARLRERARAADTVDASSVEIEVPAEEERAESTARRSFRFLFGKAEVEDVQALKRWLLEAVGRDADLIVDAVILRKSRLQLAAALGISHAATRKRLERALCRARRAFLAQGVSQPGTSPALVN